MAGQEYFPADYPLTHNSTGTLKTGYLPTANAGVPGEPSLDALLNPCPELEGGGWQYTHADVLSGEVWQDAEGVWQDKCPDERVEVAPDIAALIAVMPGTAAELGYLNQVEAA